MSLALDPSVRSRDRRLAFLLALAVVAGPQLALGQGRSHEQNVRDDLNLAKAALHGQR